MYIKLDSDQRFKTLFLKIKQLFSDDSRGFDEMSTCDHGITVANVKGSLKQLVIDEFSNMIAPITVEECAVRYTRIQKGLHLHRDESNVSGFIFPLAGDIKNRVTQFYALTDRGMKELETHEHHVQMKEESELATFTCVTHQPQLSDAVERVGEVGYEKAVFCKTTCPHSVEINNGGVVDSVQLMFHSLSWDEGLQRFSLRNKE